MPQPSTPADCSLGKASMTSPHSRCPRAPMRTMNTVTLRDDQMQFYSYWPKSVRTHPSYLCTGGMQEPSGHVMGGGRWGGIEAPNLPSFLLSPFSVRARVQTLTALRHCTKRSCAFPLAHETHRPHLNPSMLSCKAPHPLIHRLHLAAHDPHPLVTLKLGFAGCYWDLETRGTRDDVRTGWAADGRRRERLPLPRAYDKYYDDDLGASTRHSCMPSAHTEFCANGLPPKLLWARATLVVYVTPHPRHIS
ncbi:hypothetical protein DFH08DRAFT_1011749 [Mycena albidolilacea]|uniref:Uncharacterized protein n=1 Tax=Mycena albidolilacea TaxID=1033008 RepID=A0AAD7EP61_9AGAR|nr:hypothetical protein DFH08DRAFT_1011749 [Mycena albidolilacea]